MQEKQRRRRSEALAPAGGGADDGAAVATQPDLVTVTHGPYAESLPVAERSVGEIRQRFRDRLDIHPEATALVDGTPADEDTVVRAGQLVMFVRRSGEKGGGPWKR